MGNFTITNIEKEFLEALGISCNGNGFTNNNTGDIYSYVGTSDERREEFDFEYDYTVTEFKGENGSILLGRRKNNDVCFIPTVVVKENGMEYSFVEKQSKRVYVDGKDNKTEEIDKILENGRDICIIVKYGEQKEKKAEFGITLLPKSDDMSLATTRILNDDNRLGLKNRAYISSTIYGMILHLIKTGCNTYEEKCGELDKDNYIEILNLALGYIFVDDPEIREFYEKFTSMIIRSYETALYVPAMNAEYFRNHYENNRSRARCFYKKLIEQREGEEKEVTGEELNNLLNRYNREETALLSLAERHPLPNGTQK